VGVQVVDCLERIAKVRNAAKLVAAPVGSPSIYQHRNTMRFTASSFNRLGLLEESMFAYLLVQRRAMVV
jgi:hypothetical protein